MSLLVNAHLTTSVLAWPGQPVAVMVAAVAVAALGASDASRSYACFDRLTLRVPLASAGRALLSQHRAAAICLRSAQLAINRCPLRAATKAAASVGLSAVVRRSQSKPGLRHDCWSARALVMLVSLAVVALAVVPAIAAPTDATQHLELRQAAASAAPAAAPAAAAEPATAAEPAEPDTLLAYPDGLSTTFAGDLENAPGQHKRNVAPKGSVDVTKCPTYAHTTCTEQNGTLTAFKVECVRASAGLADAAATATTSATASHLARPRSS